MLDDGLSDPVWVFLVIYCFCKWVSEYVTDDRIFRPMIVLVFNWTSSKVWSTAKVHCDSMEQRDKLQWRISINHVLHCLGQPRWLHIILNGQIICASCITRRMLSSFRTEYIKSSYNNTKAIHPKMKLHTCHKLHAICLSWWFLSRIERRC